MKFYRVRYSTQGGVSAGFSWHSSLRNANASAKAAVENDREEYEIYGPPLIQRFEIPSTKAGIMRALRLYASHPDNG